MGATFGEFFKQKRIVLGMTLRQFCAENGLDPGNISKIERIIVVVFRCLHLGGSRD